MAFMGLIGMHVDDGLCAGDGEFDKALQQLEKRFPFGSKREKNKVVMERYISIKRTMWKTLIP